MTIEQIKRYYQTHTKIIISITIVLVAVLGVYLVYVSQPKSITDDLEISYKGYDGSGTISYNSDEIDKKIATIAYRAAGLSNSDIDALLNDDYVALLDINSDASKTKKLLKAEAIISDVSYHFDKTSGLSNGDKVKFQVSRNAKSSPIKSETKTFTVKGLTKVKNISIAQLLKENPVTVSGFNGYGKVDLPKVDDNDEKTVFEVKDAISDDSHLKNGDKLTLKLTKDYLESLEAKGERVDKKTIEYEVSGLKELTSISNINDLLAKNDTLVKSKYENSDYVTYTLEKQRDYIKYISDSYLSSSAQLSIVSVYKITSVTGTSTSVSYNYYGYNAYILSDNTLNLDTAKETSNFFSTKDLENLYANLESDGYSQYTETSN